ncbi:efflux RND transporter periplasmic adaptor subunit [Rhizobium bangladeshense]|uniref:efflux RND transporter periplasmic adaptor subunit n=1 Tax=Rhizobium bangladeshense TaxID=1138189 RepID=UPI001A99206B|nr:efflux RND transporter periplasmic adaptor subunit [Rhizobium bangladeshense]MBX4893982.1 efflux RND transporter periplasmic adaptor subunit [Rhizobium bangladeshense]MBX4899896.1 efflux RND transporter periplasmic adaptor subunit [Rhizobium bangladeshense]MBX4912098.1 efflux RND transporter periplasmic adaptor subunit [Rhizobium bangladeshense]MBY3612318.1 efflux RND transporter periplasmic adaptor subunit [Rhizobium bangladeshense]QSY93674.1 efflux RND transporter periplasmic adaptor subu
MTYVLRRILMLGCITTFMPLAAMAQGAPSAPPPVTVAKPVVRDVVDNDEFIGRFQPVDEVSVRSRVGGYLQEVHFEDGALVKQGDLLFIIDQRPFITALNQAKAALEAAQSTLVFADAQYKRAQSLASSGSQSAQTLDDRRREFDSAQANVRGAQAAADRAALDLEYTEIKAPLSGRIDRRLISTGNLVQADQTVLTTIVSLDPIDFYFDVDERRLLNFADTARKMGTDLQLGGGGVDVSVTISDSTAKPFKGKLDFAENRVDNESGTIRIRARLANPDLVLQPGLFGRVQVAASNTYKAILVPDEAIGSDQNERVVYVVDAQGKVSTKPVRPGPRLYGYRVIREGLDGAETIIVNGLMRARPGSTITPQMSELPQERQDTPPEAANAETGQ